MFCDRTVAFERKDVIQLRGKIALPYLSLTIKHCTAEHFSREHIRASPKLDQLGYHLPGASITGGKYLTSNSSITAIPVLMSDVHRRRPRPRFASNVVARYFVKLKGFRRSMQFSWKDNKNNGFIYYYNLIWRRKLICFIIIYNIIIFWYTLIYLRKQE